MQHPICLSQNPATGIAFWVERTATGEALVKTRTTWVGAQHTIEARTVAERNDLAMGAAAYNRTAWTFGDLDDTMF